MKTSTILLPVSISFAKNKMVGSIINVERYFEVFQANFVNIWMKWRLDGRIHRQFIIHFIFNNNSLH